MKIGGNKYYDYFCIFIFSLLINLGVVSQVFCYDSNVAHPGIVDLAVKLYNQNNDKKITAEQYEWIKTGSIEEDTPTRWLNHFYDPIYNNGLTFVKQHQSAKEWVKDFDNQKGFSMGDRTWQRAINDYRRGEFEYAFKELGHNIHVISDMLVPAHTRNDAHPSPPDSYEQYVKKNWAAIKPNIKGKYKIISKLENVFDEAANYSNNNFYSDDTIEDKKYKVNKIIKLEPYKFNGIDMYTAVSLDSEGNKIKSHLTYGADWKNIKNYVNDDAILSDHSSHLLPKAVTYSAATIKLFLDETQKNEKEKVPYFRMGLGGVLNSAVAGVFNAAENIYDYARSAELTDKIENGNPSPSNPPTTNAVPPAPQVVKPAIKNYTAKPAEIKIVTENPIIKIPTQPVADNIPLPKVETVSPSPSVVVPKYTSGGSGNSPVNQIESVMTTNTIEIATTTDGEITAPTSTLIHESTTTTEISTTTQSVTTTTSTAEIFETTTTIEFTTTTEQVATSTEIISTSTPETTTSATSTTSTPAEPVSDIVINEIAWAGTSEFTTNDEYIELYNNTDKNIELFSKTDATKRWKIMLGDRALGIQKIINPTIPAHGYYLLEIPDDRTVNGIPADMLFNTSLNDIGEDIRLLDSTGQLVDRVNASAGWFAGSKLTYSAMEKVSSTLSGNNPANWKTSPGPRLEGKVDGGGDGIPLNGSPKQVNVGSIVLKARQTEDIRTLAASPYPYILTYYEIPAGKTLNIEAGAIIKAHYGNSKIDVKGTLNILGIADSKVIFTSDMAKPKSWQGFVFYPGAVGNISGLEMSYAGTGFKETGSGMWAAFVSRSIDAYQATLNISDSIFLNHGDSTLYLNGTSSTLKNVSLKNGATAIENYDGSLNLENINVEGYSNINGPIYVKNIWPQMSQINFVQNVNNTVVLDQSVARDKVVIKKELPISLKNVTIDTGAQLDIEAGVTMYLPQFSGITVKGTINTHGTEDEPVRFIGPTGVNEFWSRLYFDGGIGNFESTNFTRGGYQSPGDPDGGVISANNNSKITMNNCQLVDNREPNTIVFVRDSDVSISESTVGRSVKNTYLFNVKGIALESGKLVLNNVQFMNVTTGITATDIFHLPELELINMDPRNFINVDMYWDPPNWVPGFSVGE